jgi:phospholipase C
MNQFRFALVVALAATLFGAARAHGPAAAPGQSHHIKTVFIILMENRNWSSGEPHRDIKGNPNAPYINNTLLPMASHAEAYMNPPGLHPSLPNYIWLEAGSNLGITGDGPPRAHAQDTHQHLVRLMDKAGVSWKAYLENTTGENCPIHDRGRLDLHGNKPYAVRHEPFTYFNDVTDNLNKQSRYCISHLRPFEELKADLRSGRLARYNWITPNECDDMHDDCTHNGVIQGDKWLAKTVPMILNSQAYKDGGALFITWDEGVHGDGPIGMIVLSPFAKGGGYSNDIGYTHGSTLRTIEEIFGVTPLLGDAADEQDLGDLFGVFP